MNNNHVIKAVIFDIDDTLTTSNSWNSAAVGLGVTHEEERDNWSKYLNGEIDGEEVNRRVLQMWKAKGLASKNKFREIFDSIPLRSDAVDVVEYLKSQNKEICLITGSMDMFAEIIAQKLGIRDYYSNAEMFWHEDDNFSHFNYDFDQAGKKLQQFLKFCENNSLKPEECVVVGDSANDYELFVKTQKGIAVRTPHEDKSLEKVAWKVIKTLSEIKDIIK